MQATHSTPHPRARVVTEHGHRKLIVPLAPSKRGHKYHVIRDHHDPRDHRYRASGVVLVPASCDLRAGCTPVYDQDQTSACTGMAITAAMEYNEKAQNEAFGGFSQLFIYYNERDYEGDTGEDGGAEIRDGIKMVAKLGICQESLWPFDESKVLDKPSMEAYDDGLKHKAMAYTRIAQNHDLLMHALAIGQRPIVFGITVYESFESDAVAQTGIVPIPDQSEQCMGGHAVLIVGYDTTDPSNKFYWVRNSWGASWGCAGYFKLPFDFVESPALASDFWQIDSIE